MLRVHRLQLLALSDCPLIHIFQTVSWNILVQWQMFVVNSIRSYGKNLNDLTSQVSWFIYGCIYSLWIIFSPPPYRRIIFPHSDFHLKIIFEIMAGIIFPPKIYFFPTPSLGVEYWNTEIPIRVVNLQLGWRGETGTPMAL